MCRVLRYRAPGPCCRRTAAHAVRSRSRNNDLVPEGVLGLHGGDVDHRQVQVGQNLRYVRRNRGSDVRVQRRFRAGLDLDCGAHVVAAGGGDGGIRSPANPEVLFDILGCGTQSGGCFEEQVAPLGVTGGNDIVEGRVQPVTFKRLAERRLLRAVMRLQCLGHCNLRVASRQFTNQALHPRGRRLRITRSQGGRKEGGWIQLLVNGWVARESFLFTKAHYPQYLVKPKVMAPYAALRRR